MRKQISSVWWPHYAPTHPSAPQTPPKCVPPGAAKWETNLTAETACECIQSTVCTPPLTQTLRFPSKTFQICQGRKSEEDTFGPHQVFSPCLDIQKESRCHNARIQKAASNAPHYGHCWRLPANCTHYEPGIYQTLVLFLFNCYSQAFFTPVSDLRNHYVMRKPGEGKKDTQIGLKSQVGDLINTTAGNSGTPYLHISSIADGQTDCRDTESMSAWGIFIHSRHPKVLSIPS